MTAAPESLVESPTDLCDLKRRLRVAYLTMTDSCDRTAWSGTHFYMAKALEDYFDVLRVGPLRPASLRIGSLIRRGVRLLTGRRYLNMYTTGFSRALGRLVERKTSTLQYDAVFAPAGSGIVAHLQTAVPIVYLSDTTFQLMAGYNADFSNVIPSHLVMADQIERLAIKRAAALLYPSTWAARSAVRDYGAAPARVHVVPFGANLDSPPSRDQAIAPREMSPCRLLFVGVNWEQKGGNIAFETLVELNRLGIPTELAIVGCRPPNSISHPHLKVFGFLNKNNPAERAQLEDLYCKATYFVLPTRAECFSIAMCEANAYGIPVLTTSTGGLPELVHEGVNGFLFPMQARGLEYAKCIWNMYRGLDAYKKLRSSSRDEFELRLNWKMWGHRVSQIIYNSVPSAAIETS